MNATLLKCKYWFRSRLERVIRPMQGKVVAVLIILAAVGSKLLLSPSALNDWIPFLTFFAVVWYTWETRLYRIHTAEIAKAERQPWVHVRDVLAYGHREIAIDMFNGGGSPAFAIAWLVTFRGFSDGDEVFSAPRMLSIGSQWIYPKAQVDKMETLFVFNLPNDVYHSMEILRPRLEIGFEVQYRDDQGVGNEFTHVAKGTIVVRSFDPTKKPQDADVVNWTIDRLNS